ncbi:MAG: UDP-N-acetylglucosamine--N-acetylmuramyl-(pentapeptide) pyrophosphoryl-undecaprenol N-acetylglucosamine transferase [Planctomycetota bacterium]|jgi:UDP-N-acetylglucosamine--N-acetylmuramyl-(pentapeptide) pyrophosphoryl-undecaprenol N-acetylglucosamine transferase|nr:UDP-N-acetylglucosamine--N-acetylmuramyl-(pentapeptide) pyrophosphoryl-undecaprenol N-acetylglucosamine transferase [Planctomycetota bacterium]
MKIWLAGGGTGGHLLPGIALAEDIQRIVPGAEIGFLGTNEGLDRELLWGTGYALKLLAAGRGSPLSWRRPLNAPKFALALAQVFRLFRRSRPDLVVALGGFAAAAPGIVARILRIPLVILEQNTVPGRVNRLLSGWARQIHSQFEEARQYFRESPATFHHSGSPLRAPFQRLAAEPPAKGDAILVMGGSQGAKRLNEIVANAARRIVGETGGKLIHVAGPAHETAIRSAYANAGVDAEVYGFHNHMDELYRRSRLVVARSGAVSIAEFAAAGLPAVLVPLPSAMDDHQRLNALSLSLSGAAVPYEEATASTDTFAPLVVALWRDEPRRAAMAEAMRATAKPDSGREIAESILSLV